MALSRNINVAFFLVASAAALLAVAPPSAEALIDFNSLMVTFQSCAAYVEGSQPDAQADCCDNLKKLVGLANTSADWQALCFFVEPITQFAGGQYTSVIASLPAKCGVDFHFKIGGDTDCSKVV